MHLLVKKPCHSLVFPAEVQGSKATAMLDSGASCNVVSADFAKALHLEIVPPKGDSLSIKLADGRTVNHIGCAVLDIVIQGVQFAKVSCLVLDFAWIGMCCWGLPG